MAATVVFRETMSHVCGGIFFGGGQMYYIREHLSWITFHGIVTDTMHTAP